MAKRIKKQQYKTVRIWPEDYDALMGLPTISPHVGDTIVAKLAKLIRDAVERRKRTKGAKRAS